MVNAQAETLVARDCATVFERIAVEFPQNYPRWSPEVRLLEPLSDGPVRVGWRGRQVRVDKGRRTESEFEVIAFEPGRQLSFQELADAYRVDYWLEPVGEQTRVSFRFVLASLSPALVPFRMMVERAVQQSAERMMDLLKDLVEDAEPG